MSAFSCEISSNTGPEVPIPDQPDSAPSRPGDVPGRQPKPHDPPPMQPKPASPEPVNPNAGRDCV